jgi:hypothetical protein
MLTSASALAADTRDVLATLSPEGMHILLAIKQPLDVTVAAPDVQGFAGQLRRYAARLQYMTFGLLYRARRRVPAAAMANAEQSTGGLARITRRRS